MGILGRICRMAAILGFGVSLQAASKKDFGEDKIIYTHANHEIKYKVGPCEVCHRGILSGARARYDHYSFQEGCAGPNCHNIRHKDSCGVCHVNVKGKTPRKPEREIEFSHKRHVKEKVECAVCHTGLDTQRVFDRTRTPGMMGCLHCHAKKHKDKTIRCASCHTDPALRASHLSGWMDDHGISARVKPGQCGVCHAESHCNRCHAGHDAQAVHPANYEFLHGADVFLKGSNCRICHSSAAFCDRCHETRWGKDPMKHRNFIRGTASCEICH